MQGTHVTQPGEQLRRSLRYSRIGRKAWRELKRESMRGKPIDQLLAGGSLCDDQEAYRALARRSKLRFAAFPGAESVDTQLTLANVAFCSRHLTLPIRTFDGSLAILTALPLSLPSTMLATRFGGVPVEVIVCTRRAISDLLQKVAQPWLLDQAVNGLLRRMPEYSASVIITRQQKIFLSVLLIGLGLALLTIPGPTIVGLNILVSLFMLSVFALRMALVWVGGADKNVRSVSAQAVADLRDEDYPIYSILVPLYKEAGILPQLVAGLDKLDYPADRLDIKLLLEADDQETLDAARRLPFDGRFDIIVVPPGGPRTKPKACNYALPLVRGEFVVIFDAEDVPEPDQLKKALVTFRSQEERYACVQCRLNYFNVEHNWITRLFTLEYTLWFDFFLPALDRLRLPIPLGGTSNHFRAVLLRDELYGWDPYNVTEDADLGLRMVVLGYRTCVIDSTTYEEATAHIGNWIRQRTRWIKGYMITWVVHMRHPMRMIRAAGWRGFVALHLFVGGVVFGAVVTPVLWSMYLLWLMTGTEVFDFIFPTPLLIAGLFNLIAANALNLYLNLLACLRRRSHRLFLYSLSTPLYWVLQSYAGIRALWQSLSNPFYWEKTQHGIDKAK
jgi:cellulose synthase/poly-beta-1,6-N-acetylglucosamine synthase-like glycosyltransferase